MSRLRVLAAVAATSLVSLVMVIGPGSTATGATVTPIVRSADHHDLSPPLRNLPPLDATTTPGEEEFEPPALPFPTGDGSAHGVDPVLQTSSPSTVTPPANRNFDGQKIGEDALLDAGAPPDTNGDVSATQYVQTVNSIVSVYTKDGTRIYGPAAINTLFQGFGGFCEETNDGDPVVQYDPLADRWVITQFAFPRDILVTGLPTPPFHQCVAVSQTSDATGSYYRYDFEMPGTKFNDYAKVGVWPDGYYMSINQFDAATGYDFASGGALAFERPAMLQGQDARVIYIDESTFDPGTAPNYRYGGQLPSDLVGTTPPPAGEPNFFLQFEDSTTAGQDKLLEFKFHVDWTNPANSTFGDGTTAGQPIEIPVADFDSNLCDYERNCLPEKDATEADYLDTISDRLMYPLSYHNFGDHESLVMNHTVDVGDAEDHAGIRWYELRDPNGTPTIFQQSTYSPDAQHRWMGSASMDEAGNIALGFSITSPSRFPAIGYTGRRAGDPLNQMTIGDGLLYQGKGSQQATSGRWGDYSSMMLDPDGCTFWYTTEYYPATNSFLWNTRIGAFAISPCGDARVTTTAAPVSSMARGDVVFTSIVEAGANPADAATVTESVPPEAVLESVESSTGSCTAGAAEVTCSLGNLPAGALETVTMTVRSLSAGTLASTAELSTSSPDPDAGNNSSTGTAEVLDLCTTPGVPVLADGDGDSLDTNPAHDVLSLSLAEPFVGAGKNHLAFTIQMADLSSLPPNTTWPASFTFGKDASNANQLWFVAMRTNASGTPSFGYGKGSGGGAFLGGLETGTGFTPGGTITLILDESKIAPASGGPLEAGKTLTAFLSRIRVESGTGNALTPDNMPNSAAGFGSYTLQGPAPCEPADLSVSNTPSSASTLIGRNVTHHLQVTNGGSAATTGVTLVDALAAGTTFVSATPGCSFGGGVVTCAAGSLAGGASKAVDVTVHVEPSAAGTTLHNTALAFSDRFDPTAPSQATADVAVSDCTVVGTAGSDTLTGTSGRDILCGFGGSDTIRGLGGDDVLRGGPGNDTLAGGNGADSLLGEAGNDVLQPGTGNDSVVDGGLGTDTVSYRELLSAVTIRLDTAPQTATGAGTDGLVSIESAIGSGAGDAIFGTGGPNKLQGLAGNDSLSGLGGNDSLDGGNNGPAGDTLTGGAGTDTCVRGEHVSGCEA